MQKKTIIWTRHPVNKVISFFLSLVLLFCCSENHDKKKGFHKNIFTSNAKANNVIVTKEKTLCTINRTICLLVAKFCEKEERKLQSFN